MAMSMSHGVSGCCPLRKRQARRLKWRQPNRIPIISWQHRQLLINPWRGFRSEKRLLLDLPQLSVHIESTDRTVVSMFAQSVAVN